MKLKFHILKFTSSVRHEDKSSVGFYVLTAVVMKCTIFWNMKRYIWDSRTTNNQKETKQTLLCQQMLTVPNYVFVNNTQQDAYLEGSGI
jgi:hypothetical protein